VEDTGTKRRLSGNAEAAPDRERRRIGMVVHDDRGNASVSWREVPADVEIERPPLEVLDNPNLTLKHEDNFDPYSRASRPRPTAPPGKTATRGAGTRTDLRKLSEWIKMMRELEERKSRGGDSD
jgi:hypothetical protein